MKKQKENDFAGEMTNLDAITQILDVAEDRQLSVWTSSLPLPEKAQRIARLAGQCLRACRRIDPAVVQ